MKTNNETMGSATYSPEDNKLRFYPDSRLCAEDYARIKSHGFIWAPKQELFVAPMWTPDREDLLLEWCGEIGDEDKSLVDRAEERAERFGDYSEKRAEDADHAHAAVESIAGNIPLGQPILVGHHSEKRARKDAERIENGMRKAIKMWETSQYWQQRAKGAIRHAKYKERPDVRARRIKTIEAAKRKQERNKADADRALRFWRGEFKLKNKETEESRPFEINESNREQVLRFLGGGGAVGFPKANVAKKEGGSSWDGWDAWHVLQPEGERYSACPSCTVAQCQEANERYLPTLIEHYNRWIAHYENRLAYERAMLESDGGTATDRKGPEKGGAVKCWASVRGCWSYIQKVNQVSVTVLDNWGNGGANFTRTIPFDKCFEIMTAAEVQAARESGRLVETSCKTGFGLCSQTKPEPITRPAPVVKDPNAAPFEAMRETLKAGVQVVSAPQLFPTPQEICRQMTDAAGLLCGRRILEPSAGTGNIVRAIFNAATGADCCRVVAVEINPTLADQLKTIRNKTLYANEANFDIRCGDFLECNGDLGMFDCILMNPPFANGSDIKHIKHAMNFLKEGGRLVAICANGPRQHDELMPICDQWTDLGADAFKEQGTGVRTALIVINKKG